MAILVNCNLGIIDGSRWVLKKKEKELVVLIIYGTSMQALSDNCFKEQLSQMSNVSVTI